LVTIILFLPKPKIDKLITIPAFMVEMVEFSSGNVETKTQEPPPPPSMPKIKKVAPAKPPPPDPVLEALKKINIAPVKPSAAVGLLEELDQIAKLEPKEVAPPKVEPDKTPPLMEETFKELDAIKEKALPPEKKKLAPPVVEDPLKKFNELKMQEMVEAPKIEKTKKPPKKIVDDSMKPLELTSLKKPEKVEATKEQKTATDLLQELSQMEALDQILAKQPKSDTKKIEIASLPKEEQKKIYDSILNKLNTLEVAPMEVDINFSSQPTDSQDFKSELWKVKMTDRPSQTAKVDSTPVYVHSQNDGPPASDPLSLYIGKVYNKIYKNWKDPLAEKFHRESVVSFTVFPGGNIDRPVLKKSAGIEMLDTLAIKAVLESEPLPPFPKELKFPNLRINIDFKYVPEKG
jgi:TonB family protein